MAKTILKGEYMEVRKSEIVPERETEKAYAVYVSIGGRKVFMWVPKSRTVKTDKGLYVEAWVFNRNVGKGKGC